MSDQSDAMLTLAKACVWACMTGNKTISHPAPRAAAVIALRHAFNSAATILKAMHEAECRMDPRK